MRSNKIEKTLIFFKPDAIERNLVNTIFKEFIVKNGFEIIELQPVYVTRDRILAHYKDNLIDKEDEIKERVVKFYENRIVLVAILQREDAICTMRNILGKSDPSLSEKDTIRGKYGDDSYKAAEEERRSCRNLVHASDSIESFNYEYSVWFEQ